LTIDDYVSHPSTIFRSYGAGEASRVRRVGRLEDGEDRRENDGRGMMEEGRLRSVEITLNPKL